MGLSINTKHMSTKQLKNVGKLLVKAADLGIDLTDHAEIDYNTIYGHTYLWSEWVGFTLFISDFESGVKAVYSCPYDGEETIRSCGNDLDKLNAWEGRLRAKSEKKEQGSN